MIDLHTHTLFSDGELLPFELVRRAAAIGYRAIALTDHVDSSNLDFVVPRVAEAVRKLGALGGIDVIAGAEVTHVPPEMIDEIVKEARRLGAMLVVVHGETLMEPVKEGTNRAAILSGADILAHPGLISEADVILAKERGVVLEITARKGHSITNGHVARLAMKHGALMTIDTDTHAPGDLITKEMARRVLMGAGIEEGRLDEIYATAESLAKRALGRKNA